MATEQICMRMGKTTGDCSPVQLGDDIWVQTVMHGPGNNPRPIKIINRSIIYRLRPEGGEPFVVVVNGVWCDGTNREPCTSLRKFAEDLGAPVKFILTPGSGHHLSLHEYARDFPDARVCVPAGRIERNNPELMKLPNVESYAADTVPPELAAGGLEVLLWQGIVEGPGVPKFQKLQGNRNYVLGDVQPQTFLHRPSGTISNGGHHIWYRGPSDGPVFDMPWIVGVIMKLMTGASLAYMKPGQLSLDPNDGYSVANPEQVSAAAQTILDWEFDRMIDFHAALDSHLESGAHALFEAALGPVARGEWDQVAWHRAG